MVSSGTVSSKVVLSGVVSRGVISSEVVLSGVISSGVVFDPFWSREARIRLILEPGSSISIDSGAGRLVQLIPGPGSSILRDFEAGRFDFE